MRGKEYPTIQNRLMWRITPACAGKRTGAFHYPVVSRDHPRVCGEKRCSIWQILNCIGSPPRVRGKVVPSGNICTVSGITPACAGKSFSCFKSNTFKWDHPRVCGEKAAGIKPIKSGEGSPPRVRGKVPLNLSNACHLGITPACAGKRE